MSLAGFARQLFAILVLPFTMMVVVPLWLTRREPVLWATPEDWWSWVGVLLGGLLLLAGALLCGSSWWQFLRRGKGTPAPWDPPRRLVVQGPYRHSRNPMISGVVFVLAAEALLLRSPRLAAWALLFLLGNLIYIRFVEEPGLESRFEEEYRRYRRHVPRWLPRLRPWIPREGESE